MTVKYFGQQIHVRFEKIQEFFAEITARAQENLTGVRVVRAYAQEEAEQREFARLNDEYVERNLSLVRLSAVFRPLIKNCVIGSPMYGEVMTAPLRTVPTSEAC